MTMPNNTKHAMELNKLLKEHYNRQLYEVSNTSFNIPKQETIREAIRCKHCNAPMKEQYGQCEYCNTKHTWAKGEFQPRVLNSEPRIIKPLPDDTSSDKHRH